MNRECSKIVCVLPVVHLKAAEAIKAAANDSVKWMERPSQWQPAVVS